MKWAIDAIAAIVGLAVGAGVMVAVGPAGGASADCTEELERVKAQHAAMAGEIEQVTSKIEALDDQLAAKEGKAADWPSDAAKVETEDGFVEVLTQALLDYGKAERMTIDCSEYPCIAAVRFEEGVDGTKGFEALEAELDEAGFESFQPLSGGTALAEPFPGGPERAITVFGFVRPEAGRPAGLTKRVGHRINQHVNRIVRTTMSGGDQ